MAAIRPGSCDDQYHHKLRYHMKLGFCADVESFQPGNMTKYVSTEESKKSFVVCSYRGRSQFMVLARLPGSARLVNVKNGYSSKVIWFNETGCMASCDDVPLGALACGLDGSLYVFSVSSLHRFEEPGEVHRTTVDLRHIIGSHESPSAGTNYRLTYPYCQSVDIVGKTIYMQYGDWVYTMSLTDDDRIVAKETKTEFQLPELSKCQIKVNSKHVIFFYARLSSELCMISRTGEIIDTVDMKDILRSYGIRSHGFTDRIVALIDIVDEANILVSFHSSAMRKGLIVHVRYNSKRFVGSPITVLHTADKQIHDVCALNDYVVAISYNWKESSLEWFEISKKPITKKAAVAEREAVK